MNNESLVSIIVPLHNDEENISYCLESIIAQTYKNIEVIVIENGSADNGYAICKEVSQREKRVKLIVAEKVGVSHARNIGIEFSRGKYIFFCDSDDYMEKSMIEKMVCFLEQNDSEIVVCGYKKVNEHKTDVDIPETRYTKEIWDRILLAERMILDNSIKGAVWNKGFTRKIIGDVRFDEDLSHCEDFHFIMCILSENEACKICYIRESLYYYYTNPNSATGDRTKTIDKNGNSKYVYAFKKMLELNFPKKTCNLINAAIFRDSVSAILFLGKKIFSYPQNHLIDDVNSRYGYFFKNKKISVIDKIKMGIKLCIIAFKIGGGLIKKIIITIIRKLCGLINSMDRRKPCVATIEETVDVIVSKKMSVSRIGDGEFRWIYGFKQKSFQKQTEELSNRLKEVLNSQLKNHIVCIPDSMTAQEILTPDACKWWSDFYSFYRILWNNMLSMDRKYYNLYISRPYMDFADKSKCDERFKLVKKIWEKRDVLIVEGEKTRLGVNNDLFHNVASIRRIICPARDAFSKYNEIFECVKKQYVENDLILIALGPTATILSYDLAKEGMQAIDIGHIDIEYEWYLMGVTKKVAITGKYVNEASYEGGDRPDDSIITEEYCKQIMKTIL